MKLPRLLAAALSGHLLMLAPPAAAQLGGGLPRLPALPTLPSQPPSVDLNRNLRSLERELAPPDLLERRRRHVNELLRRDPARFEADPAGEPIVRGELTVTLSPTLTGTSPSAALLDAAFAEGFTLLREQGLDGLDLRVAVLRSPRGLATAAALERLRALAPDAVIDFNHVYTGSGAVDGTAPPATPQRAGPAGTPSAAPSVVPVAGASAPDAPGSRVGLIDGAVDTTHPAFRGVDIRVRACTKPAAPSAHGTAVASLLVGRDTRFRGVLPTATLYAATVQCGDGASGGSASGSAGAGAGGEGAVDTIAAALAWMARERVPVVNVSLVGPANRTLEQVVRAFVAKGHVLVAAVGNDGPAAPPLYPAAYPQVVGVTAVDARQRVIAEALRGLQVMFAAPGADVAVAAGARGYAAARGTSFAAPVVAGLIAQRLHEPDAANAARVLDELVRLALDLGAPGRDPVFGHGLVGEALRTDPLALR